MGLPRAAVLSVFATALFAHPLPAYDRTCVDAASLRYFEAQTEYQNGLYELIATDAPQLDGLAKLFRDQQIAKATRRRRQIAYLLEKHPDRLVITEGISGFVNYGWTDEDNARWLKHDPEAAALDDKIAVLDARSNGHPQWPDLRAHYGERLSGSPRYKALGGKLNAAVEAAADALGSCS